RLLIADFGGNGELLPRCPLLTQRGRAGLSLNQTNCDSESRAQKDKGPAQWPVPPTFRTNLSQRPVAAGLCPCRSTVRFVQRPRRSGEQAPLPSVKRVLSLHPPLS